MNVVALIPARSGSKGVIDKNIKQLNGKPLIKHSIDDALKCKNISDVFISTDSEDYADLAIKSGAKAPFLRPKEISGDTATDFECFRHFIDFLKKNSISMPDLIVHLRPTTPIRDSNVINEAICTFSDNIDSYTSLRSVHKMAESAFKYCTIKNGKLHSIGNDSFEMDESNNARQSFPETYIPNGYVDIISTKFLLSNSLLHGDKVYPFITEVTYEIDTEEDFKLISKLYSTTISNNV
tara:strand:+ start:9447 stop:10160 length:714 start_codon:yes stop_codon:yes gene_type:complete